jgi:hypothetical protein
MTIDTSKLRISTKALFSVFLTFGGLMQIPAVSQFVLQAVSHHPHVGSTIATLVTLYSLLHNPQVRELLGFKKTVEEKTEEVTLKP